MNVGKAGSDFWAPVVNRKPLEQYAHVVPQQCVFLDRRVDH